MAQLTTCGDAEKPPSRTVNEQECPAETRDTVNLHAPGTTIGDGPDPTSLVGRVVSRITTRSNVDIVTPPPDGGWTAWLVVLGGFLIVMDTWGVVNSFGVFQPYYTTALSRSPSDISWIGSFEVFLLFFIGTFTGRLTDAGYFRPLLFSGSFFVIMGMLATSFCTSYWQLFLAQGICMGIGNGLVFTPCMAITSTYFAKKRSLAIGIVSAGSVAGGLIFPSMVRQLLPRIGFAWTIRAMASVQLGTLALVAVLMKPRLPPRRAGGLVDWTAFRELEYTFYVMGAFMAFWGVYFSFHYAASFAVDILGMPYTSALDLLLILNGVGAIGRIVPNAIGDIVGTFNIFVPMTFLSGVLMYFWIAVKTPAGLYAWIVVYGISVNAVQSIFLAVVNTMTKDPQKTGTRIGMATTIVSFACLTGTPIMGAIVRAQHESYVGAQIFSATCLLLASAFGLAGRIVMTRKMNLGALAWVKV
ncbi:major facilitator superfamily transporter [Stachybotrys elegans]|uniref:Major facilitator superfamily transporter n=1 Tax=Stachybotrys elegans TaxID=80388 RepID=A0A8K0SSH7_9HYPO|nr:major facilitator superfamily transporter [Stachybotrys elegans]